MSPTVIKVDNQSAIHLAKNAVLHGRTKHIQIAHHFIRGLLAEKEVCLNFVKTCHQGADFLTTALPRDKFLTCLTMAGMTAHP